MQKPFTEELFKPSKRNDDKTEKYEWCGCSWLSPKTIKRQQVEDSVNTVLECKQVAGSSFDNLFFIQIWINESHRPLERLAKFNPKSKN